MRYNNELDVKEVLGIESWRNLSKGAFLRFLTAMPEIDQEVALQLIGQIPEITTFAKVALEDAAKAYEGLLTSNARSMDGLHDLDMSVLAALREELAKDLTPEERVRVLDQIREVHERAHVKDTENKKFLGEQFEKRLGVGLAVAAAVVAVVFGVTKSGGKSTGNISNLMAA